MNDAEMTKLCAEAMGYNAREITGEVKMCKPPLRGYTVLYAPLHDDAQCMSLIKEFGLQVWKPTNDTWEAIWPHGARVRNADLNAAVVECVAKQNARV